MKKIVIISVVMILSSLLLFLYPQIKHNIDSNQNQDIILDYSKNTDTLSLEIREEYFEKAISYNQDLVVGNYGTIEEYKDILNFENGIIGYIEIPKINVNLPIYHGIDDEVLENGVAHIFNSSFPIEDESVHAVLSAHTALPLTKLFDDLDQLAVGDTFTVTVLDTKLEYIVTDIKTVLPQDAEEQFKIAENKNIVSLMTCYPYAVNTHRLIVTAEQR